MATESGAELLVGRDSASYARVTQFCISFAKALKSVTGSSFKGTISSTDLGKSNSVETFLASGDGIARAFTLEETKGAIKIGPKLIYHSLEFLLGAKGCSQLNVKKQITLIERSIAQKVLKLAIKELSEAVSCESVQLDPNLTPKQYQQFLGPNLSIARIKCLLSCDKYQEELLLILPYERKTAELFGQSSKIQSWYDDLARETLRGEIVLEARICDYGPRDLSEFLQLKAGDTILIGPCANNGVELGQEGFLLARGRAGDLKGSIAISVNELP